MKERRSGDGAQLSSRSAVSVFILEHDPVIDAGLLSSLAGWTDQECERMRNFRHAGALSSYCLARVLARKAISPLSGMREEEILFSEGAQGKPFLEGAPAMRFNWSHASGCVALALSRDAELGIDIEARGRKGDRAALLLEGRGGLDRGRRPMGASRTLPLDLRAEGVLPQDDRGRAFRLAREGRGPALPSAAPLGPLGPGLRGKQRRLHRRHQGFGNAPGTFQLPLRTLRS
jgi:hypothetical protein